MSLNLLIVGSRGRMGQALLRLAGETPGADLSGGVDIGDDIHRFIPNCDAVIDFSHHSATLGVAQCCAEHNKILVIGTTGHSDAVRSEILSLGSRIPMVFAPNYSVGVNLLFFLTRKTAEILGEPYDQEIVEMHHRMKKDAPSGTARRLAEILCEVQNLNYNNDTRHGRSGEPGERTSKEIGVHALRGGDVVGDHTVIYAGMGERIELTHKASSRDTFAAGAIRAALWLNGKPPGVYDMFDVLGLK